MCRPDVPNEEFEIVGDADGGSFDIWGVEVES